MRFQRKAVQFHRVLDCQHKNSRISLLKMEKLRTDFPGQIRQHYFGMSEMSRKEYHLNSQKEDRSHSVWRGWLKPILLDMLLLK